MRDDRITWGLAFGSVLLQWYFMYESDLFERALPFSTGLLLADTTGGNMSQILFAVIPIPFLLWHFSGRMESITKGYGKVYIIRNYSRCKMLLKEVGKMMATVVFLQCFAWAVFQGLSQRDWMPLTSEQQVKVMTLYVLVLMAAVLLQYCLELIMSQVYAQIITLVYYTVSLFAYGRGESTGVPSVLRWVLFPNLGFAMRNGAIDAGSPGLFLSSVSGILLICTLFISISLKIVNKKDIM